MKIGRDDRPIEQTAGAQCPAPPAITHENIPASTPRCLRIEEIPQAFDLLDRAELRTDQDFVKAHLLDALDTPARLLR